jgi:hypothetical protein
VIAAIWREEANYMTVPYGGSTRLLEAFLSTMGVVVPGT